MSDWQGCQECYQVREGYRMNTHACYYREKLGPELVFVVLNLELEVMEKRVNERHQGDQGALDMMKVIAI